MWFVWVGEEIVLRTFLYSGEGENAP